MTTCSECEWCSRGDTCIPDRGIMCRMAAGFNDALTKERLAKVCKSTPKHPYNTFTVVESVLAIVVEKSSIDVRATCVVGENDVRVTCVN